MDPFRSPDPVSIGSATGITSVEKLADIDTLVWEGARLIVRSPREMPSWRVGRNRRTAIHFRGVRYVVIAARIEREQHEYVLEPWPPRAHEHPSQEIRYDEGYVRDREEFARALTMRRGETYALAPLWPSFGFLPSPLKRVLHERYGFSPLATTRFSVLVELATIPLLMIASMMGGVAAGFFFWPVLIDSFFRISILFDDDYPAFGVAEWIVQPQIVLKGWAALRERIRRARDSDSHDDYDP